MRDVIPRHLLIEPYRTVMAEAVRNLIAYYVVDRDDKLIEGARQLCQEGWLSEQPEFGAWGQTYVRFVPTEGVDVVVMRRIFNQGIA